MLLAFFLKGIVVGVVIAVPVGPVGVMCVRRSILEGKLSGFASGLGAATADAVFGVIAGFGLGTFDHEFNAAGLAGIDRKELLEEQVKIMNLVWTGEEVSYQGKFYQFNDIDIHPSPSAPGSIPIWYCGNSPASTQR